jgi:hypothetical protein
VTREENTRIICAAAVALAGLNRGRRSQHLAEHHGSRHFVDQPATARRRNSHTKSSAVPDWRKKACDEPDERQWHIRSLIADLG